MQQEFNFEEPVEKLDRKGALVEVQLQLGNIQAANEQIASIKLALAESWGKEEATRIIELARLLEKNKYSELVEKVNELEELKAEIRV